MHTQQPTQPLTILFDASPMLVNRTGVAYYTERLAVQLAKQYPNDLQLVGFYYNFLGRRSTDHFPHLPNMRFVPITLLPGKIVFQLRRWGIEIPIELLARQKADFILYPNFIDYPSLRHTPSAPVIHDTTYLDLPEYVSSKLRSDLLRFVPKIMQRSRFVITVSEFVKGRLVEAYTFPAENILVTPIPPVPVTAYTAHQQDAALQQAGVTKPYILFLGTIEPRKNVATLIEAYTRLPESIRRSHQLVLAGRVGWYAEETMTALQAAQEAGHDIVHLGYVADELRDILFQRAAVFTWPSHYEGFGMPILEAMQCGVPIACSDIPVFRETVHDAALLYDQNNPDSIAHSLTQILENPAVRVELKRKAERQLTRYDWTKVALSVYERIRGTTS